MRISMYGSNSDVELESFPNECPHCHTSINPLPIKAYVPKDDFILHAFMRCPVNLCKESFIAYFFSLGEGRYEYADKTSIGSLATKNFTKSINDISESFVMIYNQAFSAEQYNLSEISGVGYRKAIEFLIKDYSIKKHPDKEVEIKAALLGPCIDTYISNDNIKKVAKRAVWLGNDETHYVKKWENKDINDLKKLIELTLHWIEMEELTATLEIDMPKK